LSTFPSTIPRECPNCGAAIALGAMACPQCHALIHAAELNTLSQQARSQEAKGDTAQARELWNRALLLLPQASTQAQWVRDHVKELETGQAAPVTQTTAAKPQHPWAKRLGPLAPFLLFLAKAKTALLFLFKLKFLFSFATFIGLYTLVFGWRFGVGFAVSILIHELGHFIDIKRRGLPAEMPVFLPGLGAYVKWNALGVTLRQRAQISLAGPLAGWIAAAICFLLYARTHEPVWAALARTGASINLLNLIPVWVLDGAKAVQSLGLTERVALLAATIALGLYTWEPLFILIGGGMVYRLFTKDRPQREDWSTWLYYVAVMAALSLVLHFVPAPMVHRSGI
jgi:Zn-dependent protease